MLTYRSEIVNTGKFEKDYAKLCEKIQLGMKKAVNETAEIFGAEVKRNISLPRHGVTPEKHYIELHLLDHPFAWRHGTWGEHGHDPEWGVHTVTGQMLAQFGITYSWEKGMEMAEIGWNPDTVTDEVKAVLKGIPGLMLKRPVLQLTEGDMFPPLESLFLEKLIEHTGDMRWQIQ